MGVPIDDLATFQAEVQFDKEDTARNTIRSSLRCVFDSLFCGKSEGIESDAPE